MTDERHFNDVNPDFLSADDADRLLSGTFDSGAAPEGTAELAALFSVIREAGTDAELAAETTAVAAFAAAVGVAPATAPTRKSVRSKIFSFKTAAVFGATLFSAGIAAAATGNLPDPVQRAVSNTVSHVGIDIPRPVESNQTAPTTVEPTRTTQVGPGDDAKAGEAVSGNCQAELEYEKHAESTLPAQVEKELSEAAAAKHETVPELCAHEAATANSSQASGKNGNSSTTTTAPSDHGGPGPSGASTTVAPGNSGSGKGNSGSGNSGSGNSGSGNSGSGNSGSGNSGSGNSGSGNSGKGGGSGSGDSTTTTTGG